MRRYDLNPSLGAWVSLQRRIRKDDKVGRIRMARLQVRSHASIWGHKQRRWFGMAD